MLDIAEGDFFRAGFARDVAALIFLAEVLGSHVQERTKDFAEVALVLKADHEADFAHAVLFGGEEPHGMVDANALDVVGEGVAGAFLEATAEMGGLAFEGVSDAGHFERVLIAPMHIGHGGLGEGGEHAAPGGKTEVQKGAVAFDGQAGGLDEFEREVANQPEFGAGFLDLPRFHDGHLVQLAEESAGRKLMPLAVTLDALFGEVAGFFAEHGTIVKDAESPALIDQGLDDVGEAQMTLPDEADTTLAGEAVGDVLVLIAAQMAAAGAFGQHAKIADVETIFGRQGEFGDVQGHAGEILKVKAERAIAFHEANQLTEEGGDFWVVWCGRDLAGGGNGFRHAARIDQNANISILILDLFRC